MPTVPAPVTVPVALTLIAPAPLDSALMPNRLPVTAAAETVRFPADETRESMPASALPATVLEAMTRTSPVPLPTTLIPVMVPDTADAAVMVRDPRLAPESKPWIPTPRVPVPVTAPEVRTFTSPVPLPTTLIPVRMPDTLSEATIVRFPADDVRP